MEHLLKPGQVLNMCSSNQPCIIKHFLAGGGQGQVFAAELDGKTYALKWYHHNYLPNDPHLKDRLKTAIIKRSPGDRFLWPIDLVTMGKSQEFGYLMNIRDEKYEQMSKLISEKVPISFKVLATAGFQLAESFSKLHIGKGMCYWDINFNNVFLNPNTGDILICDNDNATVPGEAEPPNLVFPGFTAPEVMLQKTTTNISTDLYSLSVLLFYLFMLHHPLRGSREAKIRHDADDDVIVDQLLQLYAGDPLFIFDPHDSSNRVLPGYGDIAEGYWSIYPQFFRDCFTEAFTQGLHDPGARVRESTWCETMLRLHDSIFFCPHCGAENFFEPVNKTGEMRCWNPACRQVSTPYRLRIGKKSLVMLHPDTQLYLHHINPAKSVDFSTPIAKISKNAAKPKGQQYGIQNCSDSPWMITSDRGNKQASPGQSVMIWPGIKINFGKIEGEILL